MKRVKRTVDTNIVAQVGGEVRAISAQTCPECEASLDHLHTKHDRKIRREGDLGFCAWCATPLVFQGNGRLRLMTRPEQDEAYVKYPEWRRIRRIAIAVAHKRQGATQ